MALELKPDLSWLPTLMTPVKAIEIAGTGTIHNVPTSSTDSLIATLRFTGAAPSVTGLEAKRQKIHLMAIGGDLVLKNENAGSLAANRIVTGTGGDLTVAQGAVAELVYDAQSSRWRAGHGGGSGGGGVASVGASGALNVSDGAGGWTEATNVSAGNGYIATGANPAEGGAVRMSSGDFVTSEGDGAEYELIGLVNGAGGDQIEIGNDAGIPIRISAGALDDVHLVGQSILLDANGWVLGDDVDLDPSLSTGTGAPADAKPDGSLYLRKDGDASTGLYTRQAGAWEAIGAQAATDVVNIMDYYEVADGGASYNLGGVAVTTKNIAMAMDRAYDAMIATKKAYTLWIPPAYLYGVEAYSWKESLVWEVRASSGTGDNVGAFEILGSGQASVIIPDNSVDIDSKLYIASGGPAGMSTLFSYRRVWWMGDEDDTTDCDSVLKTSVDMEVLIDECCFYAVQAATSAEGVLHLDCMGCIVRRTNFHGCSNADGGGGGVVNVSTGTFGATFLHTNFYPWEKDKNPLGGTHYTKAGTAKYYVILRGGGTSDVAYTKTRAYFDACTFDDSGVYGCVWADPDLQYIEIVHFFRCNVYGNPIRLFEAEEKVWHTIVEECTLDHNNGAQPTIHLKASTCERLTILRTNVKTANLEIRANTGQAAIVIRESVIQTLTVDGATVVDIDAASTVTTLASGTTPAPAARVPETAITKSDATDLTLSANQYSRNVINITGTPGGAFNILGPNAAKTLFKVINQTASACTLKKSGGTGVVIAANTALDVYHNGTDYIRADPSASGGSSSGSSGQVQTSDGAGGFSAPSNVLAGSNFVSIGASPAGAGLLRVPYSTSATIIGVKNSAAADAALLSQTAADGYTLGMNGATVSINGGTLNLNNNGSAKVQINGTGAAVLGSMQLGSNSFDLGGGGTGVLGIDNASADPTTNPTGGGILFASSGAGKWRGSGGTVTTFGPAEPHCPTCGRDFATEHRNDDMGEHLAVCLPCLLDTLKDAGIDTRKFAMVDKRGASKAQWDDNHAKAKVRMAEARRARERLEAEQRAFQAVIDAAGES